MDDEMDWEVNWGPAPFGARGLVPAQESRQVHSGVSTITAISPPSSSTMTHLLPHRNDLNLQHSSLQTALQMDPQQQQQQQPQQQQQQPQQQVPSQPAARKRKKVDANGDEATHQAEPRRLRRSHEACARCRSKKIKCDSKHPRCTACSTAGVPCHQEDRHRQTLIARGHTERIERQLTGCTELLKRHIQGFDLNNLDEFLAREGIELPPLDGPQPPPPFNFQGTPGPGNRGFPLRSEGAPPPIDGSPPRPYPYPPGPPMVHPGYPTPVSVYPYGPPPPHMMPPHPPPGFPHNIHPAFQHTPHHAPPPIQARPPSAHDSNRAEPLPHDLSNSEALAKNFGVSAQIVDDLKLAPAPADAEDLAVGWSGLASRRDIEVSEPHDVTKWVSVTMRRNSIVTPTSPMLGNNGSTGSTSIVVWLPKDRQTLHDIVNAYFARLNFHRPVFSRHSFDQKLAALYDGQAGQHDPGIVCSVYLVLALGTLSELNHRVHGMEKEGVSVNGSSPKTLLPAEWPGHEEFFSRALAVKPELRVTVSSLQALILLHWYLYTERQGRTLWRLVGSLVRLAIELGLHHDPTTPSQSTIHDPNSPAPPPSYSDEEAQLRIRLWGIVLLHDRGTSILLGRPLAIAPSDSNTPRPSLVKGGGVSEHFVLSAPIAEIQADIINSLYAPTTQSADSIIRHASRIIKSMAAFRRQLPESYKFFFNGTESWPPERRSKLVQDITEDQGLTLLKIGITRILLLRALFSSNEMPYNQRLRALIDAIVTSHNIIVVHNQLIRYPDIAFFVSPIPLHIGAMVILFGHMSKCERLPREVALEDVWMALDMLPSFRWRWERKDLKGGHPLITRLAEEVLKVNLHQVAPTTAPMLLTEQDWDTDEILSPKTGNGGLQQVGPQPATPTITTPQYSPMYGPPPNNAEPPAPVKNSPGKGNKNTLSPSQQAVDKKLAEVPAGLFYPFFPENQNPVNGNPDMHRFFNGGQALGTYGYQSSEGTFMLEEKDSSLSSGAGGVPVWMGSVSTHVPNAY